MLSFARGLGQCQLRFAHGLLGQLHGLFFLAGGQGLLRFYDEFVRGDPSALYGIRPFLGHFGGGDGFCGIRPWVCMNGCCTDPQHRYDTCQEDYFLHMFLPNAYRLVLCWLTQNREAGAVMGSPLLSRVWKYCRLFMASLPSFKGLAPTLRMQPL